MSSIASLTRWPCLAVVLGFALGAAERSGAQLLTNHSFNIVLAGDDPGEVFTFVLPGNAFMPSFARFDGFFENLDPFETGVRYGLHWTDADTGVFLDALGIDFTRLPGSGQLPV